MPIRTELTALAHELRHGHTRLLPMEIAERVQHLIVRIEQLLRMAVVDPAAAEPVAREAQQLLDECATSGGRQRATPAPR